MCPGAAQTPPDEPFRSSLVATACQGGPLKEAGSELTPTPGPVELGDSDRRCVQSAEVSVPVWYHEGMAMNLRVPEDLDRRLEKLAAEEHTSKSALLLQGAELVLQRHARRREISEGLDFVMSHDAELLKRLEDA